MHCARIPIQSSINPCIRSFEFPPSGHGETMQLFKLPVVVLLFIAIRSRAGNLIATPTPGEASSLVEDLVNILKSCYGDKIGYGVGLAGNLPDTLSRTLSARHLIPIVLIDGTEQLYYEDGSIEFLTQRLGRAAALIRFRHKLSVFIVEASSAVELKEIVFSNIRNSIWQNFMASYFILDRSLGCENSQSFLIMAIGYGFLNAKVLCHHRESGRTIVTFNCFTDKAPLPWQRDFNEYDSNAYVSLSRKYGEDEATCLHLDFDKTKVFGGYRLLLEGKSPGTDSRASTTLREYQLSSENDRVVTTIFRAMNATPLFTGSERWDVPVDNVDMKLNIRPLFNETQYRFTTYPREETGKVLVSQFRARESEPNTIPLDVDIDSRFGLAVVCSIAPFLFKLLFVHKPLVSAFIRLIRVAFNMDFTNLPHNNASRVYLTGLLLFAVTVQAMLHGRLTRVLTTRIPRRNVETMSDVSEFGYNKVYVYYLDKIKIKESDLHNNFIAVYEVSQCIEYVKRDSLAVCLWRRTPELLDLAQTFDLHVSSKFVTSTYTAYEIHYDWPYEQRTNIIIGKMAEAGLLRRRDIMCSPTRLADFRLTNSQSNTHMKNNNFEKMNLRELSFAFVILSVGLACATITLIAELATRYKCKIVRRQIVNGHV